MYYLVSYVTPRLNNLCQVSATGPSCFNMKEAGETDNRENLPTRVMFWGFCREGVIILLCYQQPDTNTSTFPLNKYLDRQLCQEMSNYTFSLWNTITHWHNCIFHPASAFSCSDRLRLVQSCSCTCKCNSIFAIVVIMKCFDCH